MAAHFSTSPLSVNQLATHLGISRRQVYVLLETDPEFRAIAHRVGARYRWFVDEVDAWLRSRCSRDVAGGEAAA